MKTVRRLVSVLLVLCLLAGNIGVTAFADSVLTLPASTRIIDEEAFYNAQSISKVVLSEGIQEIRARAFASSTLSEINLPDSLTFISDDAFDGPDKVTVTVNPGTYAYQWAVDNGYIASVVPVTGITISSSSNVLAIGDTLQLNAVIEPEDATDKGIIWSSADSQIVVINSEGMVTAVSEGTTTVTATAADGSGVSATSEITVIGTANTLYVTVDCSAGSAAPEETVTWTAEGANGIEPYKYRFYLYCDGTRIATRAYSTDNTYSYKFTKAGTYYVVVSLKDDDGETVEATSPEIIVSLEALTIDSVICDKETIRTTNTATWTATATGGEQPYQYSFILKLNGETIDSQEFSASDSFSRLFETEGSYQLEVTAKDNLDTVSAVYTVPVEAALRPVEITGITADVNSAVTESTITWTLNTPGV